MNDDEATELTDRPGGGFSLERVTAALRRRWMLILGIVLLTTAGAAAFAYSLPNRYEAVATVQIDSRKKSIANLENVLSDIKSDTASVESEVEVLRSRELILKVIAALDLRNDPEFKRSAPGEPGAAQPAPGKDPIGELLTSGKAPAGEAASRGDPPPGAAAKPERDGIAASIANRLKITRVRNTLLIEIRYSASDPVKAARMANAFAEEYLKLQLDSKTSATNMATRLLEEKLEGLRTRVSEAEHKIERYKAENNIFLAEGQMLSEKQLARLMEQTVHARNTVADAQAKFEQAQRTLRGGGNKEAIAEVLQSPTIRQMREQLGRASRREAELLSKYGPKHPEMQKARAEVADAEQQLMGEAGRLVDNLRNELEVAKERERQLIESLDKLKDQQVTSRDAGVTLKQLERDAISTRQLYEALLARYKQTAETQSLQLPDSRIVDRADVPLGPAHPKRKQIVLAGLAGGLVFALGLCLILEMTQGGVARPEDVESELELHHLSSVPAERGSQRDGSVSPMQSARMIVAQPRSIFAESIRGLRHEIDARRRPGASSIVLMTSSVPNEGKSAIASNLAHHYAATGKRVLLVDCDLRKCSLTDTFLKEKAEIGLAECLASRLPVERAILRDAATGLCFLPSHGRIAQETSPAELLVSPMLVGLLHRMRSQFDIVIVDSPPLLPVVDTRILAEHVDQIVFVMTWRKTPTELAKRALKSLGASYAKVAGVVVNQVDPGELSDRRIYDDPAYGERGGYLRPAA